MKFTCDSRALLEPLLKPQVKLDLPSVAHVSGRPDLAPASRPLNPPSGRIPQPGQQCRLASELKTDSAASFAYCEGCCAVL